jgi:hypothetical protein
MSAAARFLSLVALAACASASPPVADPGTSSLICLLVPARMPPLVRFLSTPDLEILCFAAWSSKVDCGMQRKREGGGEGRWACHSECCRTFNPHQVAGRGATSALGRCLAVHRDLFFGEQHKGVPPASTLGCFPGGPDVHTAIEATARSDYCLTDWYGLRAATKVSQMSGWASLCAFSAPHRVR